MKEIIENNKLIAEFIGYEIYPKMQDELIGVFNRADGGKDISVQESLFHNSWDWLMPVVEKIEGLGFVFQSKRGTVWIQHNSEPIYCKGDIICDNRFDATYEGVIQFITWYNENK